MNRTLTAACTAFVLGLSPAGAAGPEGIWLTEPDRKGQVAHVKSSKCGPSYCGTIVKVFDAAGKPVAAPTLGQRVFWNMSGGGDTFKGRAYVPAHKRNYNAKIKLIGNRMKVSGCLGPVCQSQMWQRVH